MLRREHKPTEAFKSRMVNDINYPCIPTHSGYRAIRSVAFSTFCQRQGEYCEQKD
jgi:hypothetical protein